MCAVTQSRTITHMMDTCGIIKWININIIWLIILISVFPLVVFTPIIIINLSSFFSIISSCNNSLYLYSHVIDVHPIYYHYHLMITKRFACAIITFCRPFVVVCHVNQLTHCVSLVSQLFILSYRYYNVEVVSIWLWYSMPVCYASFMCPTYRFHCIIWLL
jgi:hypothetical protein